MDEFEDDEGEDNFDPNDIEEDIDADFDPNDTEEDIDDNFDPNDTEEDIDDDFDPNDTEEEIEDDFDPNDTEEEIEDNFDPNDTEEDKFNPSEEAQYHNENIGSQSTSTVLTNKIEEIESNVEHQEQEEEIEIRSEEYQDDTEPFVNSDEIEFIKDIEELAEQARKLNAEDENIEPQTEKENAAYYAEQYYETLKEKEVVNDQDSKEGQETEELRQEVTEELKDDQESGYNSDKLEEDDIIEASKITSTEEFEYLWEVRDKLDQEGKTSEEIEEVMHEAEQMYETLKDAEILYEEQQQEKLKLVDHEDEASEEDLKEDLDRVDLIEQTVELEEKLVQQGKSQEEIDVRVEESIEEVIETTKFEENLEKIIEKERKELLNREDEESVEKEDLDRVDLIEQTVELEEKLVQQGKSQEEIDVRVEESIEEVIETTKFEENLEKIIEKERKELLNREDEESVEKEDLDRVDLLGQAVELEEKLVQQGESQEETDMRVEESIETTKFEEKLEHIIEEQKREKLKLVDHEDEEDIDDAREEVDQSAEAEYYIEVEEELHLQGISQEEIDERMEEIANNYKNEINQKQEKKQEPNVSEKLEKHDLEINEQNLSAEQCVQIEQTSALSNEKEVETYENVENKENFEALKPELDAIESESEGKKDFLEENTKLVSEESDEEETERLQELYRQETGRRPIYSRRKTKGYSQWLEQRELGSEKIKNSKSESEKIKEIKEEDWKTTLKQWIKEASEEECNVELKSELKKVLERYNEFEDLARKFMELYERSQYEKLSEKEKNILKSLTKRLQKLDPIKLELSASVFFIKKYITEQYWSDFWNRPLVNRVLSKFFKHISQKYKNFIYNKQNLLNKTNNKDHPTYIFYQGMKALLTGKDPSEVSDRTLGRLLNQRREIFTTTRRDLESGINIIWADNQLYKWLYNVDENQHLSEEVKNSFRDMLMDYRKDNGLINQDPDTDNLIGELRLAIQHEPSFRDGHGPSITKVNKYFGLFSKSQVLQGNVKNQHLLKMIYGLYQRSSGEFMLNNLGKSQISDDKGVSLSVKKALLAFNKYCASKNFLINEEVKSLQKLVLLLSWYLSDIYGVGGIYLDMKEIRSLLSIAIDKIRNLISGKTLSTKKIDFKNFKDQINNLRKLLTESQFTLLKQLYNNLDYPNNDLLINVNQKDIVLKDNGIRKAIFGTESEKISIRSLRKEYKLLIELNDGLYGGQCSNPSCNTDFKRLPAFDFHHEDPKIKTTTWNEIMHRNYDWIKNTLEAQKVKPICKNCHLPDDAKIFNVFKGIILKNDLFTYSSKNLNSILNVAVSRFIKENITNYTAASLKFEVKRWIKKRSVIEQVFNGKCISCGESRLPSLQAHHTNQDLKVHKWGDVSRKWNIKKLINDFIIEEECVCLCGNCHAMINTKNFENNVEEVLGEKYVQEVKADYYKINKAIKNNTNRIKKIKNGIFKLNIKDHLNDE